MPRIRSMVAAGTLFIAGVFLTAIACAGLLIPAARPAPTPTPVPTIPPPTETAIPLYEQVNLSSSGLQEVGQQQPAYKVTAQIPVLVGSRDPRVQAFNADMKSIVDKAVADFKQNVANLPSQPYPTESTFDLRFNILSPPGNILSLKFDIQTFYSGAAHPGSVSQTANFDLQHGRDLTLADLFLPDSDFLTPISKYCIAQLSTRDIGFESFELGATPTLQNYRNWNITGDGLMITFDEYQVGPYAAGPQTVVIPYHQLAQIIEPNGPLAGFVN